MIVLLLLLALMMLCIGVVSYVIGPVQRGDEARRLWRTWILRYVNTAVLLVLLALVLRMMERV